MESIEEFYTNVEKYIHAFDEFAAKHELIGKAQADHVCFKCSSKESFETIRALFEGESAYVYQSLISGRRIAVIRLKRGIETVLGTIYFLELSDQKLDGSQKEGFDHIEVYPEGQTYQEMVHSLEASETVKEVVRPHHTTHDITIEDGFLFRCTRGPLIEKIKETEMS